MGAEEVVSNEVYRSLVELDAATSSDVAHRVALATLAGACRAICDLNMNRFDERHIRRLVLVQLRDASPECSAIFASEH